MCPTVGLRGTLLGGVRGTRGRVPPLIPRLRRGRRGLETAEEETQKEYGRGGRHQN